MSNQCRHEGCGKKLDEEWKTLCKKHYAQKMEAEKEAEEESPSSNGGNNNGDSRGESIEGQAVVKAAGERFSGMDPDLDLEEKWVRRMLGVVRGQPHIEVESEGGED